MHNMEYFNCNLNYQSIWFIELLIIRQMINILIHCISYTCEYTVCLLCTALFHSRNNMKAQLDSNCLVIGQLRNCGRSVLNIIPFSGTCQFLLVWLLYFKVKLQIIYIDFFSPVFFEKGGAAQS